jgi:ubiquinol-cytochrome c reductase cytochrome c subunit
VSRLRLAAAGALAALALAVPSASAQPSSGIVHPPDDGSTPLLELGAQLYAGNCATCHGAEGLGVVVPEPGQGSGSSIRLGPPLYGVGERAADFYLRTGYMPLGDPYEQPRRGRVLFSDRELDALVAYVGSLGDGPPVPEPQPERGDLSEGLRLFTENCAGCHQVVGEGGYLTGGVAPPLEDATAVQIAEAVRIGPYYMPSFSEERLSDRELDSVIAYVQASQNPKDEGGWGIGHLGPVPEGLVAWLLAGVVLVGLCVVIGERARR